MGTLCFRIQVVGKDGNMRGRERLSCGRSLPDDQDMQMKYGNPAWLCSRDDGCIYTIGHDP